MAWRRWTTAAAAILVLTALGTFWWSRTHESSVSTAPATQGDHRTTGAAHQTPVLRCDLETDDRLAFSFRQQSRVRSNPSALLEGRARAGNTGPRERDHDVDGAFRWRILRGHEAGTGAARVVAQFSRYARTAGDGELKQRFAEALHRPVALKVDQRCRFRAVGALPGTPPVVVRQWQHLLATLESVGPKHPDSGEWHVDQRDSIGRYRAHYRTRPDGTVERQRREYLEVASPGPLQSTPPEAHVLGSRATLSPADAGGWLETAHVVESVELRTPDRGLLFGVDTNIELTATPIDPSADFWTSDLRTGMARWRSLADLPRLARAPQPGARQQSAVASQTSGLEALDDFRSALQNGASMRDALEPLIAHLRNHPEFAGRLVDMMAADAIRNDRRAPAFFALEEAGTDAAKRALVAASSRGDLDRPDRLRAIAALSDLPAPDASVVETLESRWSDEGTETMESRSALLALGRLQGRTELSTELRERATSTLRTSLADDQSPETQLAALEAVGNGGAAARRTFAGRVQSFVEAEDADLRRTAQETLHRLGVPSSPDRLLGSLETEPSEDVRRSIGRRLTDSRGAPSPAAIEHAARLLATSTRPDVRRIAVDFLGPHTDSDPRARHALVDRFRRGASPELLVQIGRYIPAIQL